MRTEYQRPPGFGTSKASIKAGLRYEEKVHLAIATMLPYGTQSSLRAQVPRNGGKVDFTLSLEGYPLFIIEVKSQWSLSAYKQLLRYGGAELPHLSRVCICKIFHPHVPIPEPVICKPLTDLLAAPRGSLTVIPWSGK